MAEEFNLESLFVFKLMNGEIVICEIVSENDNQVVVRYAVRAIEMFTNEEDEVRFMPWIPFTDDLITIYRHGILAISPPDDNMKQMYLNKMIDLQKLVENPPEDQGGNTEIIDYSRRTCLSGCWQIHKLK